MIIDENNCYDLLTYDLIEKANIYTKDAYFLQDVYYIDSDCGDREDFEKFGAIERNGEWVIPKNLHFTLKGSNHFMYLFSAMRNGVTLDFIHLDGISMEVELTDEARKIAENSTNFVESVKRFY